MEICNDHEDEVCYESRKYPACTLQEKLTDAEAQIDNLKQEVDDLKSQIP